VSLAPYLAADGPYETLCNLAGRIHVEPPGVGRWLGQGDRELPLELIAAVGADDL
jgi:hypothetical protein